MSRLSSLKELAFVFLKLGTVSFGGPAAHIAMMEREIVHKRGWMDHQKFMDLLAASNLIPGPNSTELAIHIGYVRAGWFGLIVAGVSFILPAMLMVMGLAFIYRQYGGLGSLQHVLFWVKPVVVAIIVQAVWNLAKSILNRWESVVWGVMSLLALVFGVHELVVLFLSGCAFAMVSALHAVKPTNHLLAVPFSLQLLFLSFLKIGAVLFGSGYVLLAFLQADFIHRYGWITSSQLLDAVIAGQVTPGPVFTTATFIGYLLAGPIGALVATIAIFLPAFILVALSSPFLPKMRQSKIFSAFLDGVNVASLALMIFVTTTITAPVWFGSSSTHGWAFFLSLFSLVALTRFQVNSIWLIGLGVLVGLAMAWG